MAIIGEVTNAMMVAKSTNAFIFVIKKAVIVITPKAKMMSQIQYTLFSFVFGLSNFKVEAITLGWASKQVRVVLSMVVKAAIAIII